MDGGACTGMSVPVLGTAEMQEMITIITATTNDTSAGDQDPRDWRDV